MNKKTEVLSFPVVGIGASAGGFEALEQFFKSVPNNCGLAIVVIQHLDPNRTGIMPELIQRFTQMEVFQVSEGLRLKPNCVYVIPPNNNMIIKSGCFHLFSFEKDKSLRLPIDVFFRSLAEYKKEKSIGIILSGMGNDGSLGVKAIKEKNGLILVQKPETAKFDSMPLSAIKSVNADIVAPADLLPQKLLSYLKSPKIILDSEIDKKFKSSIHEIAYLLYEYTGHDFSQYKKSTLFRRIERRKDIHQIDKIKDYVLFLKHNPSEIDILFKELLIGVTSFFRDKLVWDKLKDEILPHFLEQLPDGYSIRAWIPGCSTGEEAYSLAIVFKEALAKLKKRKNLNMQIFATDIDTDSIEIARKGIFKSNISADVSKERLSNFFNPVDEGYLICTSIREMIVFAPQNLIKDPPFTKLDIVSCRNLMIYIEAELQRRLINLFSYSLNSGGIMLLGSSETLGAKSEAFIEIDTKLKIYKRTTSLSLNELIDVPSSFFSRQIMVNEKKVIKNNADNIQTAIDQLIIRNHAPASVLVNKTGDIIYITGQTGKYLEPAAGKANWNIHVMAKGELRQELPVVFRTALTNFSPVVLKNIKLAANGGMQLVDVTVQQIESPESLRGMILVVFKDNASQVDTEKTSLPKKSKGKTSVKDRELETEIQRLNEELKITREETQTSQEELKSMNEELQSTNEELQSSNEELTSSKEEMQSLNEELQTVNLELQNKVNEYSRAKDDMKNLLNSTEIATLFLDKELNIRRYTDKLTSIFKIRNADLGRPFTDLVSDLQYPDIQKNSIQVLKSLASKETAVNTTDGRWYNVRIMPYRTIDDHIDGLVITFSNISKAKQLEIELKKANPTLRKKT